VVTTGWGAVYGGAALEGAGALAVVIEADQGAPGVQRLTAPVFDIAQEVVQTAGGAEVLTDRRMRAVRLVEGRARPAQDGQSIVAGGGNAPVHAVRRVEGVDVVPSVGEQRDGVPSDGTSHVRGAEGVG